MSPSRPAGASAEPAGGPTAPLFLAVDGGNSKTDVLLGAADGGLLTHVRGPGSSPHQLGTAGAVALLGDLVARARARAGLAPDAVLDRAEVYLAGADLPVEVAELTAAVGAAGWARTHRVDNDTFALLAAGTRDPAAVGVVCGAGINCVGRAPDGRTARFPALGQLTGDWGGGHHLAAMALWHAARGEDGRGPATALSAAVAAHFGRATVEDVGIALHLGELPRQRLDELTAVLFTVAEGGDPVALRLIGRQATEIVAMVRVAASRLRLLDREFTVVLGGGVLTARHPLLHQPITEGVAAIAPAAAVTVVGRPPVVGAALLALDALAADPEPFLARVTGPHLDRAAGADAAS
ncbi:MAG TPA: BadF/BadG/BcrA/BcrD ATPase family protein [Pilimelia sp.]|nr:BadF/BadG/BcrA/BcrD ATPase family protein [Pilimelia sp.]